MISSRIISSSRKSAYRSDRYWWKLFRSSGRLIMAIEFPRRAPTVSQAFYEADWFKADKLFRTNTSITMGITKKPTTTIRAFHAIDINLRSFLLVNFLQSVSLIFKQLFLDLRVGILSHGYSELLGADLSVVCLWSEFCGFELIENFVQTEQQKSIKALFLCLSRSPLNASLHTTPPRGHPISIIQLLFVSSFRVTSVTRQRYFSNEFLSKNKLPGT